MDPNKALEDLREQVDAIRTALDLQEDTEMSLQGRIGVILGNASELVDSFDGLDNWLSKKGFLPRDWER